MIHENLVTFLNVIWTKQGFRYDAHPMGIVISSLAVFKVNKTLSTLHPEANTAIYGEKIYQNEAMVNKQIFRCLGKLPTIAACVKSFN